MYENGEMDSVRMDKWLWAARFFKTRALAAKACELGRIESNQHVAKAARDVLVGEVLGVSEVRGPAAVAQTMYRETEESKFARAQVAEARKAMPVYESDWESGRPTKRDRRVMNRFRGRG